MSPGRKRDEGKVVFFRFVLMSHYPAVIVIDNK